MIEDLTDIIFSLVDFQNKIDIELSDTAVQPLDVIYWLKQTSQIYVTYDCVYENIKNVFLISDSGFETKVGLRKLLLDLGKIQCQEKIFEKNFENFLYLIAIKRNYLVEFYEEHTQLKICFR